MRRIYRSAKGVEDRIGVIKRPGAFIPVFDSTDHFHFSCKYCREIADVLLVERDDSYAEAPTVYFHMRCPKCEAQGFRKIYLADSGKHFLRLPVKTEMLAKRAEEAQPGIQKRES